MLAQRLMMARSSPARQFAAFASDPANLTSYTFTGVSLGTVSVGRFVVVCVMGWSGSTATRTVSSLTLGGTAATALINPATQYAGAIFGLYVPTGATADIAVTFSGSMVNAAIAVYAVTSLASTTPVSSGNAGPTAATSRTVTLTTAPGDVVIGHAMAGPAAGSITSWSGVAQDTTSALETAPVASASGLASGASTAVTVNVATSGALVLTAVALR